MARHRLADLFVDTLPYNAHATTSDALWAGLPELITKTQEEYEARAIELANDPAKFAEIKAKLHSNLKTSPLFNGEIFARHIGAAYEEMHRRHISGETPDHICVKDWRG